MKFISSFTLTSASAAALSTGQLVVCCFNCFTHQLPPGELLSLSILSPPTSRPLQGSVKCVNVSALLHFVPVALLSLVGVISILRATDDSFPRGLTLNLLSDIPLPTR